MITTNVFINDKLYNEMYSIWLKTNSDQMSFDEFIDMFINDAIKVFLNQIKNRGEVKV